MKSYGKGCFVCWGHFFSVESIEILWFQPSSYGLIFVLVKRADAATDNSSSMLNGKEVFSSTDICVITGCEEELDEVFGESGLDSARYDNFLCFINWWNLMFLIFWFPSSESDSDKEVLSQSSMIKQSWMKRKHLLEHDIYVTGCVLSILHLVGNDVVTLQQNGFVIKFPKKCDIVQHFSFFHTCMWGVSEKKRFGIFSLYCIF